MFDATMTMFKYVYLREINHGSALHKANAYINMTQNSQGELKVIN